MTDLGLRELERQAAAGDQDAITRLSVVRSRIGRKPMLRMQDYLVKRLECSEGCDGCDPDNDYDWHDRPFYGHVGALEHFLAPGVEIVFSESDDDYQGNIYALLHVKTEGVYAIWHDYFGSCGGCDSLIDASAEDAFTYVKATMAEGNTRQFWTVADAAHYLRTSEDYSWSSSWGNGLGEFRAKLCEMAGVPAERLVSDDDD